MWPSLQFIGGLQGSCSKPIRVHTEFPAIPFKSICPLDGNICISFNNYSKGFAKWNCFLYIRQFWFFFAFRVIQGVKIGSGLGVTSEKKPRWFKDIMQISADPPSPYLILDIFILDKYELVFTPLPLPNFWHIYFGQI